MSLQCSNLPNELAVDLCRLFPSLHGTKLVGQTVSVSFGLWRVLSLALQEEKGGQPREAVLYRVLSPAACEKDREGQTSYGGSDRPLYWAVTVVHG